MATVLKQNLYGTIVSLLTTELNALANGSAATGSAAGSDAVTAAELYGDFELALASLTPTGTPSCDLYLIRSADGTNYEDATPPPNSFVGTFTTTTGAGVKRSVLRDIPLPPGLYKPILVNNTNVALAASGSTLKVRPHSLQNV